VTREVTIAGSPCRAKLREPAVVVVLTIATLGLYSIYWWYEINREMSEYGYARAADGLGDRPGMSALAFSGLSVFTLYIAFVWTVVATTGRVQRAQDVAGTGERLNGWVSAALWIFTLTLGGIAYTQSQLNKVWAMQESPAEAAPSLEAPAGFEIEDPERWPSEHPAIWDSITRRAYKKEYGKLPGI
jgi:Domain of unknown function (DUF4234)